VIRNRPALSRKGQPDRRVSAIDMPVCARTNILWMLALAVAGATVGEPAGSTTAFATSTSTNHLLSAPSRTVPPAKDVQVPTASDPGEAGNPLSAVSLESLSNTRDRPLFSASRRPPGLPVIAPSPPPLTRPAPRELDHPRVVLVGTVVGQARDVAVLLEEKTQAVIRLRRGQEHDGWALRRIGRREVTLEKGGQTAALALSTSGADQALWNGPVQNPGQEQPNANTSFAYGMLAPETRVERPCLSGPAAAAQPGDSVLCALGRGRASIQPSRK
jgi:general secretion pathway protein N